MAVSVPPADAQVLQAGGQSRQLPYTWFLSGLLDTGMKPPVPLLPCPGSVKHGNVCSQKCLLLLPAGAVSQWQHIHSAAFSSFLAQLQLSSCVVPLASGSWSLDTISHECRQHRVKQPC